MIYFSQSENKINNFVREEILLTLKNHLDISNGGVNGGVKIFEYIRRHPGCRANVIAEAVDTTTRTLERHIRQLREQGKIEFRGAPKTGGYYICGEN